MRNIDQLGGLCNETRLLDNEIEKRNIVSATILTDINIRNKILVPRMNLVPTDLNLSFKSQ